VTVLHSMRYLPIISPGSPKVRESPQALARFAASDIDLQEARTEFLGLTPIALQSA